MKSKSMRPLGWILCLAAVLAQPLTAEAASRQTQQKAAPARAAKAVATKKPAVAVRKPAAARVVRASVAQKAEPAGRPSFGQMYGLHGADDPLDLKSSVAFVVDQDTNEVLLAKNTHAVLPIASITKLMTALVVTEAHLSMDETLTITDADIDTEKGSRSRLAPGTQLTRGEMLHLALMSSENRAANALGRHYPGGLSAFVAAMNTKAKSLGMADTRYVEPTGLSSSNQSSARDLATLVKADYQVAVGKRQLQYHTTNRLVRSPDWDIGLQKTGYITEAGQCLVMQAKLAGRELILVLLDSAGKYSRIADAERIRRWLASHPDQAAVRPIQAGRNAG